MLGAPTFVPVNIIKSVYQCVSVGNWSGVFSYLRGYPNLAYTTDNLTEEGLGWTLIDYAVFQGNLSAIKRLRKQHNDLMCLNSSVVLHLAHYQQWHWIMQLLNEKALSVNVVYAVPGMDNFTLLDLANNNRKTRVANDLRNIYQAWTFEQIQEYLVREALFRAAHHKDWQTVYAFLDIDREKVNMIDVWFNHDWVLLQYAYAQQNQAAILKLIEHYSASLDEIRNTDLALYNCIVSFYEMAKQALFYGEIEALTLSLEKNTITPGRANFGPIARPLLPAFNSEAARKKDDYTGPRGLSVLEIDFPSKKNKSVTLCQ